jgi:hypothetical protein
MTRDDVHKLHQAALARLDDLVQQRTRMLRDLAVKAQWANELMPETGRFGEFDTDQARDILAKLDAMTPAIGAAIDELNSYADKIGRPEIE